MYKKIFGFIIYILTSYNLYSQGLSLNEVQKAADQMIISKGFDVSVKELFPSINDLQIAVLKMPYREFPSIIIFKKNPTANKWIRIFESLSPGIQDQQSKLLDWHTIGTGIDFTVDDTLFYFNTDGVRALVESTLKDVQGIIIPYQHFLHMHTDSISQKDFVPYTIDKTKYYDYANILFNNRYKVYPSDQCMMFDSPDIEKCDFTFEDNKFKISILTSNNQIWIYRFTGVDSNFRYLINKEIEVKNAL